MHGLHNVWRNIVRTLHFTARIQNDDIRFPIKAVHSILDAVVVAVLRSTVCIGKRLCAENTRTKTEYFTLQTVTVDDEWDEN